jgi:hypothetical protein
MISTPTLTDLDVKLIEQAEAEYFRRFLARIPETARTAIGIKTTRLGGGIATAMVDDPTGYWTKAMGFGFDVPVDDSFVAEVIAFSRAASENSWEPFHASPIPKRLSRRTPPTCCPANCRTSCTFPIGS